MWKTLSENPIFWKVRQVEDRRLGTGLKGFLLRYGGYLMVLVLPLGLASSAMVLDGHFPADFNQLREMVAACLCASAFMQLFYVTFRALSGTFSAISLEREQQTYGPLVSTALSAEDLALGKVAGGLWPLLRELTVLFPTALTLAAIAGHPHLAVLALLVSYAAAAFFGMVGFVASVHVRSTQNANRWAAAVASFVLLGTPVADWLLAEVLDLPGDFIPLTSHLSPLAAIWSILAGGHMGGSLEEFWLAHMWVVTLVLYCFGAWAMWSHAVTRLRRPIA